MSNKISIFFNFSLAIDTNPSISKTNQNASNKLNALKIVMAESGYLAVSMILPKERGGIF
jgi:hypothetical protein